MSRRTGVNLALELWLPVMLFGAWWVLSSSSTSLYFPPLAAIVDAFVETWVRGPGVAQHVVPSLLNLAAGLGLAALVGIGGGVALGLSTPAYTAARPVLEFLRAVPGVALLPLALSLLGIGPRMQVAVIVYGTIWPILLNTVDGVRAIDPVVRDVTRSFRLVPAQRLTMVVLPAASPQIVAGLRTSLSIGITVMVFSELIGATRGIGYSVLQAQRSFAVPRMWAGMLLLGIVGYALNVVFRGLERLVLGWHHGMRAAKES